MAKSTIISNLEELYKPLDNVSHMKHFKIIEMLDYDGYLTRFKLECTICGYGKDENWSPTYDSIVNGKSGCPPCGRKNTENKKDLVIK